MTAPGPVFVAGPERSGTSLLYALLGSHPDIAMTRRTNLWRYVYGQYGHLADAEQLDRCLADLARYKRLRVLDLDFEALRSSFLDGPPTYARLFELIGRQVAERAGKPRWGDKSLLTERFAREIVESYPGARILHMVRDPRDRYASVRARWGRRLGGVGAGAAEWVQSVELALRNQAAMPGSYRIVSYEELVTAPERTLLAVCEFIEAPWNRGMLAMDGAGSFREGGGNSSYGDRPAGAISADSVGRYLSVLTPGQVDFIEAVAGPYMEMMGYDSEGEPGRRPLRGLVHPFEMCRFHAWRLREAMQRRRPGRGVPGYRLVGADAS